jgi:endogenous inhibitor of DNA gyrase (YacG/DUF329 family)
MGQMSTYLFARNDRPGFAEETLVALGQAGVIEPGPIAAYYQRGDADWVDGAFEYLGAHRSPLPFIIPQDPAIAPDCPECGRKVYDEFYETINEIDDEGQEVDWSDVKVTCPHCQRASPITALKDAVGVFCRREYLFLSDVNVEDLAAFEAELRKILPDAEIKSYGYT